MSDEWQQVKEVFHVALRLKPEDRSDFLDEACSGDDPLRREIESLLASHSEDSFLEQPAIGEIADVMLEQTSRLTVGAEISHYRIISQLGAGGMGEVYLADDTSLKRKVAIKLLNKISNENPDHLRRFFQEARSASALNHPNILTIHEIGEFNGTRFIAAEYVNGKTLRDHLKRETFDLGQTLGPRCRSLVRFRRHTKLGSFIGISNRKTS